MEDSLTRKQSAFLIGIFFFIYRISALIKYQKFTIKIYEEYMMKLLTVMIFFLATVFLSPIFSDSVSDEKADRLCSCLKNAKKSNKRKDKKACLTMREKHVRELGKGSEGYNDYINRLGDCEREMMGVSKNSTESTYEEKVISVCDCFKNEAKENKFKCFQMQSELGKAFSSDLEKKKAFNSETNACDK
jgi:hypothetical protein